MVIRYAQGVCSCSGDGYPLIDHTELFIGQPPLENEGVIGPTSLYLIKSGLYGIKHGGIALAYGNTLLASIDHRATSLKLTGAQLDVVVGDRRVLVGRHNAVICQQLYNSRLV